jgi:hypothetical protein
MQCLAQSHVAEGLEEALHGTRREQTWTQGVVWLSSDENDRYLLPTQCQLSLQIGSGHTRHGYIKDQASGVANALGGEEFLGRRERPDRKAELLQKIWERFAHGLVIIDDGYE